MDLTILQKYQLNFPSCADLIATFHPLSEKKLWHELSIQISQFMYHKKVKGRLTYEFYTKFVKHISNHINKITHFKILKECLVSVQNQKVLQILERLKKEHVDEEDQCILEALEGNCLLQKNLEKCYQLEKKFQSYLSKHKNVDNFIYSVIYRFSMNYFHAKSKFKLFYEKALNFLAYTPADELNEKQKFTIIVNMAITCLCSPDIYNFSELLQQPLLLSLSTSQYKWLYDMLQIFRKGDVNTYDSIIDDAVTHHKQLKKKRRQLDRKIRLMCFIELAFNLPKGNKIVSFETISKRCGIPESHTQFLVMKAAAQNLVKVEIDEVEKNVNIKWVAPRVLQNEHLRIICRKLEEWNEKVGETMEMIVEQRN